MLYQIYLTSPSQWVDLQLTGGRYRVRTMGINYQVGLGNIDSFNIQFQAQMFAMKGSKANINIGTASPIQYLTYGVPTSNSQMSQPMEFVIDYFGAFQLNVIDLSTGLAPVSSDATVKNNRFAGCIMNLDIEPYFHSNNQHLE